MDRPVRADAGAVVLPIEEVGLTTEWLRAAGDFRVVVQLSLSVGYAYRGAMSALIWCLGEDRTALRKIDISDPASYERWSLAGELLSATRGRLLELVGGKLSAQDIALNCTGLQKLDLKEAPLQMADVLKVVGPTLQSLTIRTPWTNCVAVLKKFRDLCPKLSTICLRIAEGALATYAAMLCSYGPQLHLADLSNMPAARCRKVVESRLNMQCQVTVDASKHNVLGMLNALGPSLKKADVTVDFGHGIDSQELSSAMHFCTRVEELNPTVGADLAASTI